MSAFSDALRAVREVILLHKEVSDLRTNTQALAGDLSALGRAVVEVRDRVSRLEGYIDGAAAASQITPRLPRG